MKIREPIPNPIAGTREKQLPSIHKQQPASLKDFQVNWK